MLRAAWCQIQLPAVRQYTNPPTNIQALHIFNLEIILNSGYSVHSILQMSSSGDRRLPAIMLARTKSGNNSYE
ncbi:MAG: hypothetical protein A2W80_00245 [Candidatus Riflebacteria bacterium GWC2_50_8]|nr:MAG: hypothetical protein A2W80_00245 [Candidatus Riflebacteria bacterium GWC2_50_8]